MNSDLANLIELQKADSEIARLQAEIASLPKKVAAIEAQLAGSKDRSEKAKAALKADEMARRKYESDIEGLRQKISKYRDQMLSVKTNQEYQALGHEITFAEQNIAKLEDGILETMVDADNKTAELKRAEGDLKAHTSEIEKEKAIAKQRTAEDEKLMDEQKQLRDGLRKAIDSDILRQYDRVLKFRGSAIAEALDHRCAACQVLLRPQVYNDLRSTEKFITCDSCQRILYYDPAHDSNPIVPRAPAVSSPEMDSGMSEETEQAGNVAAP
jgi:hypothetical protein